MDFFEELKRRHVVRVGLAYLAMTWILLQLIDILFEMFGVPGWVARFIAITLALGFIPALLFAWAFEITPDGIKLDSEVDRSDSRKNSTGRKLDHIIIALLLISTGYFFWESKYNATAPTVAMADRDAIDSNSESSAKNSNLAGDDAATSSPAKPGSGVIDSDSIAVDDSIKSIAVLPFVNMSSDPEQEFFSDGISEELLNVLTKLPNLNVAARTSSFQFKGKNLHISQIAKQLNVNHILEGSVRKGSEGVRVTAQLILAKTGYHLWSENYDRPLQDILVIQDNIAAQIAKALSAHLVLRDGATFTPKVPKPANVDAYEAFIKGRYLIHRSDPGDISDAVSHLQRALELDPAYAPAHAQLATALLLNAGNHKDNALKATAQELAQEHIEIALAIDYNQSDAHAAQALLSLQLNDYEAAVAYADEAIRLNPNNTSAQEWRVSALNMTK